MKNNWKTTLAGMVGAAVTAAAGYFTQSGDTTNWQAYATAAGLAAVGYLAKDAKDTNHAPLPR